MALSKIISRIQIKNVSDLRDYSFDESVKAQRLPSGLIGMS